MKISSRFKFMTLAVSAIFSLFLSPLARSQSFQGEMQRCTGKITTPEKFYHFELEVMGDIKSIFCDSKSEADGLLMFSGDFEKVITGKWHLDRNGDSTFNTQARESFASQGDAPDLTQVQLRLLMNPKNEKVAILSASKLPAFSVQCDHRQRAYPCEQK